jgi:hypothetical protein
MPKEAAAELCCLHKLANTIHCLWLHRPSSPTAWRRDRASCAWVICCTPSTSSLSPRTKRLHWHCARRRARSHSIYRARSKSMPRARRGLSRKLPRRRLPRRKMLRRRHQRGTSRPRLRWKSRRLSRRSRGSNSCCNPQQRPHRRRWWRRWWHRQQPRPRKRKGQLRSWLKGQLRRLRQRRRSRPWRRREERGRTELLNCPPRQRSQRPQERR